MSDHSIFPRPLLQPLQLRLLDLPPLKDKMDGLCMELEDCAFPLCACPEVYSALTVTDTGKRLF